VPEAGNGPPPILTVRDVRKAFGGLPAVAGATFSVAPGSITALIGPNGAGKTTLFRLISGEMKPSAGRIWFRDKEITGRPQHMVVRLGVAKSYQITNIFPHLSVLENVRVAVQGHARAFNFWTHAARLPGVREKAQALLVTIGLADKAAELAATLSHGEKRHLEIAIALASDPTLLLLDEPTAGMSPEETDETMVLIRELARGRTVVLVEHKMKLVMKISDRITVLHQGAFLAEGTPDEIRANPTVQQTYLGVAR
jgi:branched-chain amino acid transport system ATP-binding protein